MFVRYLITPGPCFGRRTFGVADSSFGRRKVAGCFAVTAYAAVGVPPTTYKAHVLRVLEADLEKSYAPIGASRLKKQPKPTISRAINGDATKFPVKHCYGGPNRTPTVHRRKTLYFAIFTNNNVRSYLLWPPVVVSIGLRRPVYRKYFYRKMLRTYLPLS